MTDSNQKLFIRQFIKDFFHTGAILPSSRSLGRAGAAYLAQKRGPTQVLEVGAGTGPFTQEIVPLLTAGDTLDVVEINADLMDYLKNRFKQDPQFHYEAGVTVNFITDDVRRLDPAKTYDYIIFSLPLTNFPSTMVEEILGLMLTHLKPGGIFSYVHYIFFSRLKYLVSGPAGKANMRRNQAIIKRFATEYQIERRAVLWNVPPSWVYYWQKPA